MNEIKFTEDGGYLFEVINNNEEFLFVNEEIKKEIEHETRKFSMDLFGI